MSFLVDSQNGPMERRALAKLAPVAPGFMIYLYEQIGDTGAAPQNQMLKLTGCMFRAAAAGPRKGELCIMVPGTQRTTFLSPAELSEK